MGRLILALGGRSAAPLQTLALEEDSLEDEPKLADGARRWLCLPVSAPPSVDADRVHSEVVWPEAWRGTGKRSERPKELERQVVFRESRCRPSAEACEL